MATTTRLNTYADLRRMPDDGRRYELIGGEIVVSPAPTFYHQEILTRLAVGLRAFVIPRDLGVVGIAPLDIQLSPRDCVQPDLVFISKARLFILTGNGTEGPPDLVVEVLSPSTRGRDESEKRRLYAAAGVPEYWLADPETKQFRPYTLTDDGYQPIPIAGSVFRSVVLPGFEIDLTALFAPFP